MKMEEFLEEIRSGAALVESLDGEGQHDQAAAVLVRMREAIEAQWRRQWDRHEALAAI